MTWHEWKHWYYNMVNISASRTPRNEIENATDSMMNEEEDASIQKRIRLVISLEIVTMRRREFSFELPVQAHVMNGHWSTSPKNQKSLALFDQLIIKEKFWNSGILSRIFSSFRWCQWFSCQKNTFWVISSQRHPSIAGDSNLNFCRSHRKEPKE